MQKLIFNTTKKKEVIDVTRIINDLFVKDGYLDGVAILFAPHTSCALITCDLDPGTENDYLAAYEAIVPKLNYVHPHDPSHAGDHIMSTLLGVSLVIPVQSASMVLGPNQKVALVELSGPRERRLNVMFLPEKTSRL